MPLDIRQAAEHLAISVGGYLYGTRRGPGFCAVCTTPVTSTFYLCKACYETLHLSNVNSTPLADLVLPLVYIDDQPQSKLLMHGYKGDQVGLEPQPQLLLSVALMATLGILIHRVCIERAISSITSLTYVPSTRGRFDPPIRRIVNFMSQQIELPVFEAKYVGPSPSTRGYCPDHYEIFPDRVDIRHVLLVDDTWTSGGNAQSLASTLKLAGSQSVTILVVGRWLRRSWQVSADFMATQMKQNPYNPFDCPVTGRGSCSGAIFSQI